MKKAHIKILEALFFIFLLFNGGSLLAYDSDSLNNIAQSELRYLKSIDWSDSEDHFRSLDTLIEKYFGRVSTNIMQEYFEFGQHKAYEVKNDTLLLQYLVELYPFYEETFDYEQNEKIALQHIEIARKLNNNEELVIAYIELGLSKKSQQKFEEAIEAFTYVLTYEGETDDHDFKITAGGNLASCYMYLGRVDEGIRLAKELIAAREGIESDEPYNTYYKLVDYTALISGYLMIDDTLNFQKEIISIDSLAITLDTLIKGTGHENTMYYILLDIYAYLGRYYILKGDFEKAKVYNLKVKENSYAFSASKFLHRFQYEVAVGNYDEAGKMYREYKKEYGEPKKNHFFLDLAEYYENINEPEKAIAYYKRYYQEKTKILQQNKASLTELTQLKIENQKKENNLLKVEIEQTHLKQWNIFYATIAGLFLTLLLFFVYRNQLIQKRNKLTRENLKKSQYISQQAEKLTNMTLDRNKILVNIAHEFQTPLSVMLGLSDRIVTTKNLSQEQLDKHAKTIKNNAQLISSYVSEILEKSRVEGYADVLEMETFDISEIVEVMIEDLEFLAEKKNIHLNLKTTLSNILVHSDQAKITIILRNIITNALQHTPKGGMVNVLLLDKNEEFFEVLIKDTGVGIPQKAQEHIFKRYYKHKNRLNNERSFGIGLSVCKEYIDQLGGQISFNSVLQKGTTFIVQLPRNQEEIIQDIEKQKEYTSIREADTIDKKEYAFSSNTQSSKNSLLIIEDNVDFQYFIENSLSEQFNLIFAKNGLEAKSFLQSEKIDLILTDWMMPDMDGESFISYLSNKEDFISLPVILLSAKSLVSHKLKMLDLGANRYLTKPITADKLIQEITTILTSKNHSQKNIKEEIGFDTISRKDRLFLLNFEEVILEKMKDFSLNLEGLASEMNISVSQLNRRIKKITGQGTKTYIQELRFWEARRLLEEGQVDSVKKVCFSVGFKDTKNFSRNFKKRFGKYPSDYL